MTILFCATCNRSKRRTHERKPVTDNEKIRFLLPDFSSDRKPVERIYRIDPCVDAYAFRNFSRLVELRCTWKQEARVLQRERNDFCFMTCIVQSFAEQLIKCGQSTA